MMENRAVIFDFQGDNVLNLIIKKSTANKMKICTQGRSSTKEKQLSQNQE